MKSPQDVFRRTKDLFWRRLLKRGALFELVTGEEGRKRRLELGKLE